MTHLQPITYRGELAALAGPDRLFLTAGYDQRPDHDPDRRMVIYMCFCAHDVALGRLPGPYTDSGARRYARGCLLAPGLGELLERPDLSVAHVARAVGIPEDELRLEILERPRVAAH